LQKPIIGEDGIDVSFGGRGRNADGGLDFEKFPIDKKSADCLDDPGAQFKVEPYISLSKFSHWDFLA
jgi:hypothetical protein